MTSQRTEPPTSRGSTEAERRASKNADLPAVLRGLMHAVVAAVLVLPISRGWSLPLAAVGAAVGAALGARFAKSRYRSVPLVGAGLGLMLLALGLKGVLVGTTPLAGWLGPAQAFRVADGLLFFGVMWGGSFSLRVLSARRTPFLVLEVLVAVFAFTQLVAAHRDGAINRPFEIADPILATGGDPSLVFLGVGAFAAVVVALLLLAEERGGRAILHLSAVLALLALLVFTTRLVGMPAPPAGGDGLGLRGDQGEEEGANEPPRGGGGSGGGANDSHEFRDNYESDPSDVPVGVVIFRDDYSAPAGVYYFRQGAFSQWNGRRLVASTLPDVDRDLVQGFPVASTEVRDPPPLNATRSAVHTTVVLLADHTLPFALESALRLEPAQNPDPSRFRVAYNVVSAAMNADYFSLLEADTGAPTWSSEALHEYTQAPPDPRYRALAESILQERVPADLRDRDAAKVFAITEWLGEQGIYSLRSHHASADDPTAHFLFGDRTGYCVHFAHAAAYLFRSLGLPARVATGYAIPESNRQGGSALLVSGGSSHAWPEVYFQGYGWVIADVSPQQSLDPPPPPPDADLQRLLGELARGQSTMPPSEDNVADAVHQLIEWLPRVGWGALFSLFALLLGLYGVKCVRRLAPRWASDERLARAVHRASLDRLSEVALSRQPGETRHAFAARVADAAPSLARISSVAEGRALGSPRAHAASRVDIEGAYRALRAELARAYPLHRRLRGLLTPWTFLRSR